MLPTRVARRRGLVLLAGLLKLCSSFSVVPWFGSSCWNVFRHVGFRYECSPSESAGRSTRVVSRAASAWRAGASAPGVLKRHRCSSELRAEGFGEEVEGKGENNPDQPKDTLSEGGEDELGAERMELRDFRARLMSKGLDGWGATEDRENGKACATANSESKWAHTLVRPELGCLVLAGDEMFIQQQQYFYRAVILVIQHGEDGTVGLMLNRPTTFTMGDVCKGDLIRVPGMEDNVLYMGGDVAGARDDGLDVVNLMHGREDLPGMEVVKGIRLGGLKEALALVTQGKARPEEFKFFSRYAGWGPGQLEAEVLAGRWTLAACDIGSVLQSHNHPDQPGHFWNEIQSRIRRSTMPPGGGEG